MSKFERREIRRLSEAVSEFADAMRRKLWKKFWEGEGGWSDASDGSLPDGWVQKRKLVKNEHDFSLRGSQ